MPITDETITFNFLYRKLPPELCTPVGQIALNTNNTVAKKIVFFSYDPPLGYNAANMQTWKDLSLFFNLPSAT